jgi:hypothetical protein
VQRRDNPLWSPVSTAEPPQTGSDPEATNDDKAVATPEVDSTGSTAVDSAQDCAAGSTGSAAVVAELCGGADCKAHFAQLQQQLQQRSAALSVAQVR